MIVNVIIFRKIDFQESYFSCSANVLLLFQIQTLKEFVKEIINRFLRLSQSPNFKPILTNFHLNHPFETDFTVKSHTYALSRRVFVSVTTLNDECLDEV